VYACAEHMSAVAENGAPWARLRSVGSDNRPYLSRAAPRKEPAPGWAKNPELFRGPEEAAEARHVFHARQRRRAPRRDVRTAFAFAW
jgi:hypothetical protein